MKVLPDDLRLCRGGRLHYISQLEETELAGKLAMSRERDRILGYTSSGIHKDELEMTLGGYLIRRVGCKDRIRRI